MSEDVVPAAGFEPGRFLGTWRIALSSYPFWSPPFGHRRLDPEVTYARLPSEHGESERWLDEVRYRATPWLPPKRKLRERAIVGTDVMQPGAPGHFVWTGDGPLAIMRSHWYVLAYAPDYTWAVTYFPRSNLGSSPGVDVFVRSHDVDVDGFAVAREACKNEALRDAARGMIVVPRSHAGA